MLARMELAFTGTTRTCQREHGLIGLDHEELGTVVSLESRECIVLCE
jgi:hypothetical protein